MRGYCAPKVTGKMRFFKRLGFESFSWSFLPSQRERESETATQMQLVDDILITLTNDIFQSTPKIKIVSKFFVGHFKSPKVHANLLVDYTKWERHVRNFELYPYKDAIMLMANLHPGADLKTAMAQWRAICDWPGQPPPTPSVISANSRRFFSLFKHTLDTGKLFLSIAAQLRLTLGEVFHIPPVVCDLHHLSFMDVLSKMLPFACMKSLVDFHGTVHLTSLVSAYPSIQIHFKLDDPMIIFPIKLLICFTVDAFKEVGDNKYGACVSRSVTHQFGYFGQDVSNLRGFKLPSEFNLPEDTILTYLVKRFLVREYNIAFHPNVSFSGSESTLSYYLLSMGVPAAQAFIESATIGPYCGGSIPEDIHRAFTE
jgi:hypothetical protein